MESKLTTIGELLELFRPDLTRDKIDFWLRKGWIPYQDSVRGNTMKVRAFSERAVRKVGLLVAFYRVGYSPDKAQELAEAELRRAERPTVLLIEDDPDWQQIIAHLLAPFFHVVSKSDSASAIAYLHQAETPPDLVSVDLKIPAYPGSEAKTDVGYDLLKELGKLSIESIIVASGNVEPDRLPGFDPSRILSKPFHWKELLAKACEITGVHIADLQVNAAENSHAL